MGGGSFLDGIGMKCTSAMVGVGLGLTEGLLSVVAAVVELYCDDPEVIGAGKYCCTGSCPISAKGLKSSASSGIAAAAAAL